MSNLRIIISSHDTLVALGLKILLSENFAIEAHIAPISYFSGLNYTAEPDFFFIDSMVLINNISFFLPRKSKTIVFTNEDHAIDDIITINSRLSVDDIVNSLQSILNQSSKEGTNSEALSTREIEVLRLIASGKINKEIAQVLNISVNTVLTHRKNLTAKLGIKSVSGLSFYAMMNGIV